jgi:hypothetical protein
LASYDLSALECGVITNGWNIVRLAVAKDGRLRIWLNNMWVDAVNPITAARRIIPPRLDAMDSQGLLPPGTALVYCESGGLDIDYVSVLPASVLPSC